jgi:hypothetical protein
LRTDYSQADIAPVGELRLAGVDPHPDLDLTLCSKCALRRRRSSDSHPRTWERDEERVTLRVDLDAVGSFKGRPKQTTMLVDQNRVRVAAALVEQPSRSFDVREQKGDGPGREVGHPLSNPLDGGGVNGLVQAMCVGRAKLG